MTRIAVIGPIEPFRSGVARHTTALARSLTRRPETRVRVFSFSRQYPALLFPGESDRARDACPPDDLDSRFAIDSINPLSWLRVARDVREYRPDVVIAPMWTFFLAPCSSFILARVGSPVVAVVHNVADHDGSWFRAKLSAMPLARANAYVTHTQDLAAGIRRVVRDAHVVVHPHPVFDYPKPQGKLTKRADLELLMFGLVRPYKGLDVLLTALAQCRKTSVMLSVVGESWQSATSIRGQIDSLGLTSRVELVLRYVSDAEAAEYFERADVVVLPYRTVTGSGVLPLALHYGKPVAASDLPGFRELVAPGQNGWLVRTGDAAALAQLIDERLSREAATSMLPMIRQARQQLSFDHFAEAVLEAAKLGPAGS